VLKSPNPVIVADLFPELLRNLLELLKGLEEENWARSTVCAGWSVKDVALHLLGGDIGNLSSRRDGHSAHLASGNWDELVSAINNRNREWIDVARRISSPLLIDLSELCGIQMAAYFQSLDPHSIGGSVSWVGPNPAPVWLDIAREYTERWHHQQHIRDALDRPGLKEPRFMAPVLTAFAHALPRTFRHNEAPENTVVTLTISGESGGQWSIRQEADIWEFYEGTTDQPEAEIVVDEDVAWRLFTRGLKEELACKPITLSGDMLLGATIVDMVSIIA